MLIKSRDKDDITIERANDLGKNLQEKAFQLRVDYSIRYGMLVMDYTI